MKGKFGKSIAALLFSSLTFAAPVSSPNTLNDTPVISGGSGTCGTVDLTNATSDYMLQPCETAIIRFNNQQFVPLHIAIPEPPSPSQPVVYEVLTFIYSASDPDLNFELHPNNVFDNSYYGQFSYVAYLNWAGQFNTPSWYIGYGGIATGTEQEGAILRQVYRTSYFWFDTLGGILDNIPFFNRLYVIYYGANYPKHVASQSFDNGSIALHTSVWENTTTPWSSLGTIAVSGGWPSPGWRFVSGQVIIRRIS
jgi:hypothetical protein